ncbi:adenosylcobinamide-GDP ribazoletransferase [Poseidonibacter ostreae]|jgi:adenosylcobinamide-GDP ribazoletransferase|uniref:Adenosylcobinamide-GDP ribazoletransferase n=1 Tax=Poseidonibacter ostreae TaxID=2654171 RepID=A0A6L4WSQ8_9BACT|nr:adenosylcobinamide-GDP ribazoletransferase [Poseidonibacter ostreae]KAB7886666.1 adenosylcobinamide-GDP ribazoletransferase [Poseidonibacter ostreae]KAB7889058.1 adenosylcobinamide-GDP ribazoletransferase [Poseidonibacter ostreae]KAB7891803.1 adenosylcobinamide-GDP ribazoletransferase [Poseidonibacter ostreae]
MKQVLNAFYFALSYFSIIPVFVKEMKIDNDTYKYTLALLPLVGAILASLVIGLNILLSEFFNPLYAAFVASVVYLALYGFLHLEAICDVVDAWFASYSGKDPYAIMKDPTIGAIGGLYAFCFVLLKVGISTYVLFEEQYALFFTVLVFSRLNFMYLLGFFKFSKDSFLSLAFQGAGVGKLKLYTLVYVILCWYLLPSAIVLLFISMLSFYFVLKVLNRKFSFVNGDCLGFTLEHTELILLNIGLALIL